MSETLAARLWPGLDPIGRMVSLGRSAGPLQVIGVSADITLPSNRFRARSPRGLCSARSGVADPVPEFSVPDRLPQSGRDRGAGPDVHPWLLARTASPADDESSRQLLLPRAMAGVGGLFTIVAVLLRRVASSVPSCIPSANAAASLVFAPRSVHRRVGYGSSCYATAASSSRAAWCWASSAVGSWRVRSRHFTIASARGSGDVGRCVVILGITAVAAAALPARRAARTDPAALLRHEHE